MCCGGKKQAKRTLNQKKQHEHDDDEAKRRQNGRVWVGARELEAFHILCASIGDRRYISIGFCLFVSFAFFRAFPCENINTPSHGTESVQCYLNLNKTAPQHRYEHAYRKECVAALLLFRPLVSPCRTALIWASVFGVAIRQRSAVVQKAAVSSERLTMSELTEQSMFGWSQPIQREGITTDSLHWLYNNSLQCFLVWFDRFIPVAFGGYLLFMFVITYSEAISVSAFCVSRIEWNRHIFGLIAFQHARAYWFSQKTMSNNKRALHKFQADADNKEIPTNNTKLFWKKTTMCSRHVIWSYQCAVFVCW